MKITCNYPSGIKSNAVKIRDASAVDFNNVTFEGPCYNTIMTGQQCSAGKYIENASFTNCNFNEQCRHINIWFGAWKDGAVLNIKNCNFTTCEQALCFGDYHYAAGSDNFSNKLTVNIENCTFANYEKGDPYEGIIICDSRNTTEANFAERNPFSNVTFNFKNVTAGGTALTKSNFLMGTQGAGQMLYLYRANGGVNYVFGPDTKDFFPKVYVNGELIDQLN